jgi:hypothetical protein
MADLASSDVTVVITDVRLMGRKRRVTGTIAFGDGAKTYPVGGVPLPSVGTFGFYRQMDTFKIIGNPGGAAALNFAMNFDTTNRKLQLYAETTVAANQPLIEGTNALAPAAATYQFEAWGW